MHIWFFQKFFQQILLLSCVFIYWYAVSHWYAIDYPIVIVLLMFYITLIDFLMPSQPFIPVSCCIIIFLCYWSWFANIFLILLYLYSQRTVFGIRGILASKNELKSDSCSPVFWNSLWEICIFFCKCPIKFTSHLALSFYLWENFKLLT